MRVSVSTSPTRPIMLGKLTSASLRRGLLLRHELVSTSWQGMRGHGRGRVFAWRGKSAASHRGEPVAQGWTAIRGPEGMRYAIDRSHPAVAGVLEKAAALAPLVFTMLRVIEETVPVQRIWLDTVEGKETPRTSFAAEPPDALLDVLATIYRSMIERGMTPQAARKRLLLTEPFDGFPEIVNALTDDPAEPKVVED